MIISGNILKVTGITFKTVLTAITVDLLLVKLFLLASFTKLNYWIQLMN